MKLPNADKAVIAPEKPRDYLLNEEHPQNLGKARLLRALGYGPRNWSVLANDLREQHLKRDAIIGRANEFSQGWLISASLVGPSGRATMLSVWAVPFDTQIPHLVSLYRAK